MAWCVKDPVAHPAGISIFRSHHIDRYLSILGTEYANPCRDYRSRDYALIPAGIIAIMLSKTSSGCFCKGTYSLHDPSEHWKISSVHVFEFPASAFPEERISNSPRSDKFLEMRVASPQLQIPCILHIFLSSSGPGFPCVLPVNPR